MGIVHSFPRNFGNDLLEALAQQHGSGPRHNLMSHCNPEPLKEAWDDVQTYLQSITCNTVWDHNPFRRDKTFH